MSASERPARRILYTITAMAAGLAVALLLAEALARIFFDEAVQPRYVIDPGYGVRANQANVATRHYVPGDYDVGITTNSAGMRGQREYPVERVAGKRRILLLGDSFIFGYGVNDDEVISVLLEDQLNARAPGSTEVINLAVSGFGQAEELVTWEHKGKAYRPDIVVMFYFDNDVANNAVAKLYTVGPDGAAVRTGASFLPGSNLQEKLFAFAPTRWLFEHSQAWNLIRHRLSSLVQRSLLREQGMQSSAATTPAAVELTRALLRLFVAEVRAAGAKPVLVVIPDRLGMATNFPLSAEELQALGVPWLDGRQFLTRDDYYRKDSHWRPVGHRLTAERLAALIELLPP